MAQLIEMPKMNKVYCRKCQWYKFCSCYIGYHRCDHPDNYKDTFLEQSDDRKEKCSFKNMNNDCKDYSPLVVKPESLISKLTLGLME